MKTPAILAFVATSICACTSSFYQSKSATVPSSNLVSGSPKTSLATSIQPTSLTFIVINDTYRLDNFPYLRSLRTQLEQKEGPVVVLHAGDFLFPSQLSKEYKGKQMIDIMNQLDGNAIGFDQRMLVTFGNHEFEKDKVSDAPMLQSRIDESQFFWLGSNLRFKYDAKGQPMIDAPNLVDSKMLEINGIKVGFVSATTHIKGADYIDSIEPAAETMRALNKTLRMQGANLIIAVTHQTVAEDKALLTTLGEDAPDFIAGGHEHDRQRHLVNGRNIIKADADATSAAIVRIALRAGHPQTAVEYVSLPGKLPADVSIKSRIDSWNKAFGEAFCPAQNLPVDCMAQPVGHARVELVAEELTIRRFETNLGDFLADTAREAYAAQGAQIAFLNSGGMRLNYNIPAGPITRTHIETLFAFPAKLGLIRITGAQLQAVLDHAITDWTGNGRWLQISGFAFRHDPVSGKAEKLSLITPNGLRPILPDETLLAVTNDFLLDASHDQDGFRMLDKKKMLVDENLPWPDLKERVLEILNTAGDQGIAPAVDGRICNRAHSALCLVQ